jgi:hypothetical protein
MWKDEISGAEKRQHARRRMFKGGRILFFDNVPVADCVVKDVSISGARVQLRVHSPLPQKFRLAINQIGTFDCEVARASGLEFGVKFAAGAEQCAALFQDWPAPSYSATPPLARAG